MATNIEVLYLSKNVAASTEDCVSYTPANGKKIKIADFYGETSFSASGTVKAIWDYGGAGEEILWLIHGSGEMPAAAIEETERTADGVKKIALCLDNTCTGAIDMAGVANIEVFD